MSKLALLLVLCSILLVYPASVKADTEQTTDAQIAAQNDQNDDLGISEDDFEDWDEEDDLEDLDDEAEEPVESDHVEE